MGDTCPIHTTLREATHAIRAILLLSQLRDCHVLSPALSQALQFLIETFIFEEKNKALVCSSRLQALVLLEAFCCIGHIFASFYL